MINIRDNKTQERIYDVVLYFSYFLMIVSSLGLSVYAPKYLQGLKSILNIYVSIVLLWRFNPLRQHIKFNNLDRKIAFSAGIFMITTTLLNTYLVYIKKYILDKYTEMVTNY